MSHEGWNRQINLSISKCRPLNTTIFQNTPDSLFLNIHLVLHSFLIDLSLTNVSFMHSLNYFQGVLKETFVRDVYMLMLVA